MPLPPPSSSSSAMPRPIVRLALAGVLLLGVVLGFVALFHQQPPGAGVSHDSSSSSSQSVSPPVATDVFAVDDSAPAAAAAPSVASAASPNTAAATTSTAARPAPSDSKPTAAAASSPSLFSAFTAAVGPAAGGKQQQQQQQQQQQGDDITAEADAVEGGGFLSVKGCTPDDAKELRKLVEDSSCRIITLVPEAEYNITAPMAVRRPVAVIGRPLGMPTLDGHLSYRAFHVEEGGRLDLRYVRILRGKPRAVIPGALVVLQGTIAYVERGGALSMTGCRITIHPSTVFANVGISRNPQITTLVLGGGIFSEGGTLRITGCIFYSAKPGVAWREAYFIGNEILIMTGNVLVTGCVFSSVVVFSDTLGVGGFVFNVAGTVFFTGCVFNANGAFYQSSGIGYLSFNGAGLSIFTGCANNFNLGLAVFFGGGLGMMTGSGVTVMTGLIANVEGALSAGAGMGFQSAIGSGVVIRTGIIQNIHAVHSFGCGVGHSQFIGAGTAVYTNIMLARTTMLPVFYGVGGYLFLGSGTATITNTVGGLVNGIGVTAGAGIGTMIMAGWLVRTNNLTVGISLILAVFGQGTDLMVMSGGAVLTFNRIVTAPPPLFYLNPGNFGVWIAGNGFFLRPDMLVAIATHQGLWRLFQNTTAIGGGKARGKGHVRIAHQTYWVYRPQAPKPGKSPQKGLPAPTPAPAVAPVISPPAPPPESFIFIGIPFFGGRQRQLQSQQQQQQQQQEEQAPAATAAMPSAGDVAAAVGKLWAMDDAGVFATLLGSAAAPLQPAAAEEEESPLARIGQYLTNATAATAAAGTVASVAPQQQQQQGEGEGGPVFIADTEFDSCRACDIGSGRLAGPGAAACVVEPTCHAASAAPESASSLGQERMRFLEEMWVLPPGSDPANTSVAVLDLTSSSSPPTTTVAIDPAAVAAAVNATVRALGLPERFHLRVVSPAPLLDDDVFAQHTVVGQRRRRRRMEEEATGVVEGPDAEREGEWSPLRFKAYVVSDWGNVTAAVARGLSSARGGALLTQFLGDASDDTAAGVSVSLHAKELLQVFVPGNGAGVFPGSTTTAGGGGAAGNRGLSLVVDRDVPSALLYSTRAGQEEALVTDASPGATYALVLDNFPADQLLSLRLTPPSGAARLLGRVPSSSSASRGASRSSDDSNENDDSVRWKWRVAEGTPPGQYFIEVASQGQHAFAYSQAFRVV